MRGNALPQTIVVIPPWSHDSEVRFDPAGRERFRKAHGLEDKFVVMYSGNHSPCHPLDTLLAAAGKLAHDPSTVFCFIGGGSEWRRIGTTVGRWDGATVGSTDGPTHRPTDAPLLRLPYQPLSELAGSLSAADVHVVVMGEPFVGLVHPCKIYNILAVGAPVLYIGPQPSHVTEIFGSKTESSGESGRELPGESLRAGMPARRVDGGLNVAAHGEVEKVVEHILRLRKTRPRFDYQAEHGCFAKAVLLPRLIAVLEGVS